MTLKSLRVVGLLVVIASLLCVGASRAQAADLGRVLERAIGKDVCRSLEAEYGLVNDPVLSAWVAAVGNSLEQADGGKPVDCDFKILDADFVNAMAIPNGTIYVTRGLMETMDSEDELAMVLGHEVTHISERHALDQMGKAALIDILLSTIRDRDKRKLKQGLGIAGSLLMLKFSRDEESQADMQGLARSSAVGYDPQIGIGFFIKLAKIEGKPPSRLDSYFATHPNTPDRITAIEKQPQYAATADSLTRWGRSFAARGLPAEAYETLVKARDAGAPGLDGLIADLETQLPKSAPEVKSATPDAIAVNPLAADIDALDAAATRDMPVFDSLADQADHYGQEFTDRLINSYLAASDFVDAVTFLEGASEEVARYNGAEADAMRSDMSSCIGRMRGDIAAFYSTMKQLDMYARLPNRTQADLRQFDGLLGISERRAAERKAEAREMRRKSRVLAAESLITHMDDLGAQYPGARTILLHYTTIPNDLPEMGLGTTAVVAVGSKIEAKDRATRPVPGQAPLSWAMERGIDPSSVNILLRYVSADIDREIAALRRIRSPH